MSAFAGYHISRLSPDFEESSPALQVFVLIGLNLLPRVLLLQTKAIFTLYWTAFRADKKIYPV